jgi:hypothetical protein
MTNIDTAFEQQVFEVPQAQRETDVNQGDQRCMSKTLPTDCLGINQLNQSA